MTTGVVGAPTAGLISIRFSLTGLPAPIAAALAAIGTVSYSLYLIHVPIGGRIVNLGSRFVAIGWHQFGLSLVAFVLSFAAAGLFWWIVERPAQRYASKFRLVQRPPNPE